jgi:hypothetical protein
LLMLLSPAVFAVTLAELQQADKLRIKTWVEPTDGIVARQQLKLQIEVATDKWFSGGTRIGHFEIKDAIVLQREKFALNSTRTEGDKTWTVQQWTVVVYPQRSGVFEVPAVPLNLSIAGENLEAITGQTQTQPLEFSATQPDPLGDKQGWIATTRFEVDERFNKSMEELKPGDALTRTVSMSADNLPAMMLPKVLTDEFPGIATYAKPAELVDKVNRGDYLAERTQEITYVFENPGEYELPAQSFYWWNLETGLAEQIILPAHALLVVGLPGQPTAQSATPPLSSFDKLRNMLPLLQWVSAVGILLLAGLWFARKWYSSFAAKKPVAGAPPSGSWLLKQAKLACLQNNDEKALSFLYQWIDQHRGKQGEAISLQVDQLDNAELKRAYDEAMQSVYSKDNSHSADTCRFINRLTNAIEAQHKPQHRVQWSVEMKLN